MSTEPEIFIEIPTWLGDAVMATPAIENIVVQYPNSKLTVFGSFVSTKLFLSHPNVKNIIIDDSKKEGNRYINLYRIAKKLNKFDLAISFRSSFSSKFLIWLLDTDKKFFYNKENTHKQIHQVIRYNDFINKSLNLNSIPGNLKIYTNQTLNKNDKPILGINPGATYGSAKRWYPDQFAKVAVELSSKYDIIIFGGPGETDIAQDIEDILKNEGIGNYTNLAGKTTIEELIHEISSLNLFITNDSGPMHVAAAFNIPTVAIFGPTKYKETNQWKNEHAMLIRKDIECSPCMKRICPLKHHECMKSITSQDVIDLLKKEYM